MKKRSREFTCVAGIMRSISKYTELIKDVNALQESVKRAFHIASTGRPGPVVLDLPVEIGLDRKGGTGGGDRIEREGKPFMERVRAGYLAIAKEDPHARLLDASREPEKVQARIRKELGECFPGTFPPDGVE